MTDTGANKNNFTTTATSTEILNVPIAIVGIGCLFPQANDKETFWANIKGGVDSITDIPETHWRIADLYDPDPKTPDKTYGKRGGFLDPVEFNPLEFSIQPNILEAIDTSQLLGLIAAREALKDAGYDPAGDFARERVSVLLGVTGALEMVIPLGARLGHPFWRKALKDAGIPDDVTQEVVERIADNYVPWQENSFPGLLGNVVAGRISKQFDLGGTNSVIDAACGSSLSAVHMAAMELACRRSDMVITGGIDTFNDIFMYTCFSKTPALSPNNIIRPFDSSSDGTLIGEGLGLVVLKRLADAERDNDQIYAVIRGIGTASDGKKGAIYEPSAEGQKNALKHAYSIANIAPTTVSLVEAHGTGTRVGDATEVKALRDIYGESDGQPWCALGSVKSQIGHTKASAGSAGLIKTALALYNKILPPTINVAQPQQVITSGNSPFYINTTARPWLAKPEHPRRAAVSAFGFGGSNFHCVLEEHRSKRVDADWSGAPQIVALCADDKNTLIKNLQQLANMTTAAKLRRLAAISRTTFKYNAPHCLLFVVERCQDLATIIASAEKLISAAKPLASTPNGIWYANNVTPENNAANNKLAVLFPGQGAQYPQMLGGIACHSPELLDILEEAEQTLVIDNGLSSHIYPHSVYTEADQATAMAAIQATQIAQPAIGAVSLGAWHYLQTFGLDPQAWGGHSYGELTALCAAGCFSSKELHQLSRLRGELMAGDGSDKGTMLAVSASLDKIALLLAEEKLDLVLANRNTPAQGVLSGSRAEIARAALLCKERGLRCVALDVAAAFHSKLVAAASAPFLSALNKVDIKTPKTPVYANKTAMPYPNDATQMRTLLAEQIANPVEFVQQIEHMYANGITTFVEVGPGARLTGMVNKILKNKNIQAIALDSSNGKRAGLTDVARLLIQLAASGFPIKLDQWDKEYTQQQITLPEPVTPKMTVKLCGANYVKPKPARAASTRTLVDSSTLPAQQITAVPVSTPQTINPTSPMAPGTEALRSLQENMAVLQRMQEDTAKLHNKFLEGQAAAVQTMRSLMDHQMGVTPASPCARQSVAATPSASVSLDIPIAVPTAPMVATAPTAAPCAAASGSDVATSLLEVVAEKTGYPQEMLELDMSLDADLGIDSIKRVEILSAIQEKLPHLPALQAEQLSDLQTLRQIVAALDSVAPSAVTSTAVTSTAAPTSAVASGVDVAAALLEVVAEKTGYPQEMLELDMSLDADLGIDSIKRVEILSAIQEKLPHLPALQAEQLSDLQTLRQIVAALDSVAPSAVTSTAVTSTAAPTSAIASGVDVAAALLEVVAEKTGYPQEMLELDMSLDADLGIDSIKRVEILSAIQEKLPHLPALQAEQLSDLQTLRQIVSALEITNVPETCAVAAEQPTTKLNTVDINSIIERQIVTVVPTDEHRPELSLNNDKPIWVVDDCSPLAATVVDKLKQRDFNAELISPTHNVIPDQLAALVVIAPQFGTDSRFLSDSFQLIQHCAPALQLHTADEASCLMTVSRLDGQCGFNRQAPIIDPLSGGLSGITKTASHEWANVHCKAVDVGNDLDENSQAGEIVHELLTNGPLEIGINRHGSVTLQLQRADLPVTSPKLSLQPTDVVVISGGARGVTAEVAAALAQSGQPTLLLLGRSQVPEPEATWLSAAQDEAAIKHALMTHAVQPLKPRELKAACSTALNNRELLSNLERLQQLGSKVIYKSVDIRDGQAVNQAIADARDLGPIRGIIHGAGVIADRKIEDKTLEQFELVYATKIAGLQALLQATQDDQLDFIGLFSSSTGRFGRTGQVDYAVANEVLNKTAQALARQRNKCRTITFNWGPWDGGMVTPALKKIFAAEGIGVIDLQQGAQYLLQELAANDDQVEVVILGGQPKNSDQQSKVKNEIVANIYPDKVLNITLNTNNMPLLHDHVINGKAVVPMALLIEWLAQGAMHNNPGLLFHGFDNLRIRQGIILQANTALEIELRYGSTRGAGEKFVIPMQICSQADNKIYASADIVLTTTLPEQRPAIEPLVIDGGEMVNQQEIYTSGQLFHGPQLHGLQRVIGNNSEGIIAISNPAPMPVKWVDEPLRSSWIADPQVLDSSFQMMILWSFAQKNLGSLPSFASQYRQYCEQFPAGNVRIQCRVTKASQHSASANIEFIDEQTRQLLARIDGYECTMTENLQQAFSNNQLGQ